MEKLKKLLARLKKNNMTLITLLFNWNQKCIVSLKKTICFSTFFVAIFSYQTLVSQTIECFVLSSPEKIYDDISKIAILDFNGEKGRIISEYLVTELFNENRGITTIGGGIFTSSKEGQTFQKGARTNVFSVVERTQLENVLKEQNLSNTGLIDDSQAAKIGAIMGIDAFITGTVSYTSKDEEKRKEYKNSKTGAISYSYCTTRTVITEVIMKIIDVNTGEIIGNKSSRRTASDNKCDEKRSGLSSASQLADLCLKASAVDLVNYFNPYFNKVKYKFADIKMKEFKKNAKEAENYIKAYDFNNAYAIYKAIFDADPYNAGSALNLGGIHHIVGDYNKALEYYRIAAEIEPDYQYMVPFVEKDIKMVSFLEKLGVTIEKTDFQMKDDALAAKLTTKGKKSDRIDVKADPNHTSETVFKVPGNTEFSIIENNGEWILIKLLGGKQGYINSKDESTPKSRR